MSKTPKIPLYQALARTLRWRDELRDLDKPSHLADRQLSRLMGKLSRPDEYHTTGLLSGDSTSLTLWTTYFWEADSYKQVIFQLDVEASLTDDFQLKVTTQALDFQSDVNLAVMKFRFGRLLRQKVRID